MSDLLYQNHVKPLIQNKNKIWFDEENNINELNILANNIGLKNFEVLNNDGKGLVYVADDGYTLIIENCRLKLVFYENDKQFIVKSKQGTKTIYNTNEVIIWE